MEATIFPFFFFLFVESSLSTPWRCLLFVRVSLREKQTHGTSYATVRAYGTGNGKIRGRTRRRHASNRC